MKYLKLYENFNEFDIHEICKKYKIKNYTINDDGSIDVNGNVYLSLLDLTEIPLKFRNVTGDFRCSHNKLTSLKNCPKSVGGEFNCNRNKLDSLEFCPESIGKYFDCDNNRLTSLKFMPKVNGVFYCNGNNIRDFKYFFETGINLYCYDNPIYEIWLLFEDISYIELLNDYDCIRCEDIIIDRFNEFLEEIDKPTVESVKGYNNI